MIKIAFHGDSPLEALSKAAAFGLRCMEDKQVADMAHQILAAEKRMQVQAPSTETLPDTEAPQPAPAAESPAETSPSGPAAGEPGPTAAPGDAQRPVPVPTAEQVRAKGIEAARKHGQAAVKALLTEFGVSGMSALAETDRAAFLAKLEGLGGENA